MKIFDSHFKLLESLISVRKAIIESDNAIEQIYNGLKTKLEFMTNEQFSDITK